jgi:uncharacterized membrane protein YqjE
MKQTPAEKFKHSSRYAELKRRLHEYLKNCRLKRLPNSIWLFLLRNKRLHRNNKPQNKTKAETHSTTNDETQSQQTSRLCIEYSDLSECRVSDNLHVVCESTRSILSCFNSSVLTLGTNPITFAMAMLTVLTICRFLGSFRLLKLKWIFALLLAVAQKGGMWVIKMFSSMLTTIWKKTANMNEEKQYRARVAMPASTKIITASEIRSKTDDFNKRLSLVDTGTDAYLRQDDSLMFPLFPSSTVINTAGPDQLTASKSGLLNLLVQDDKGNMHQIMLENALVVPGLSQNLTSHKQFIENGHLVFFHKNQSGIVLNKEPKFRADDIIIPFVTGENGLHYLEEYIPEEHSTVAMVAQKMQRLTNAELVHIQLCHICPTLMRHLFRVATDIPKLKGLNDFRCHCCVEAKMKHA